MRRAVAIWFASLMLLSGGFLQTALHICPEKGILLSEADCPMEVAAPKACCRNATKSGNHLHQSTRDCCETAYFYGISAKFGSVSVMQVEVPDMLYLPQINLVVDHNATGIMLQDCIQDHPPDRPVPGLAQLKVWRI